MSKPCKYGTRRDENGERKCAITCKRRGKKYARGMDGQCSPKDLQIIVYDLANVEPPLSDEELRQRMNIEFSEIGVPDSEIPQMIEDKLRKIKKLRNGTYKTKPAKVSRVNSQRRAERQTELISRQNSAHLRRLEFIKREKAARTGLPWGVDDDHKFPSADEHKSERSSEQKSAVGYEGEDLATALAYKGDDRVLKAPGSPTAFPGRGSAAEVLARNETRKAKTCQDPLIEYYYKTKKTPVCARKCGENEAAHWEKQENGKFAPICKPNCAKGLTRVNGKGDCKATEGSCKAAGLGYSKTRKVCKEPEAAAQPDGNKRKQAAPKKAVPQTFIENEEEDAMGYDQLVAQGMAPIVARNLNSLTFIEIIKDPTIENPLDKNPQLKADMIGHLIKEKVYSAKQNPEDFSNSKITEDYIDAFDFELDDHPMKKIFDFFEKHNSEEFENETQKKNWFKEFWQKETGDILENITDEEYAKLKERIEEKKKRIEQRIQEKKERVTAVAESESESENVLIDMPNDYLKPGDYAYTNEDRTCGKVVKMYEEETELNKAFNLDLDEDLINVGDSVVVLSDNTGYRRYGIIEKIEYLHPEDEDDPGEVSLKMFRVNNYSSQALTVDIALFQEKTFGEIVKHPKFDVSIMFIKKIEISNRFKAKYEADQGKKALSGIAEVVPIMYEGNLTVGAGDVVKLIQSVYKMPFSPSIVLDTVEHALGWDEVTSSTAFFVNTQYVIDLNGAEVTGTLLSKNECRGTFRTEKGEVTVPFYDVVDMVKGSKRNKPVNKQLQANYNEYLKAYAPKEEQDVKDVEDDDIYEAEEAKPKANPKKKKEIYVLDEPNDLENNDKTLDAKIALLPDKAEMKSAFASFLAKRVGEKSAKKSPTNPTEAAPKMSLVDRLAKLKAAKVIQPSAPAAAS